MIEVLTSWFVRNVPTRSGNTYHSTGIMGWDTGTFPGSYGHRGLQKDNQLTSHSCEEDVSEVQCLHWSIMTNVSVFAMAGIPTCCWMTGRCSNRLVHQILWVGSLS